MKSESVTDDEIEYFLKELDMPYEFFKNHKRTTVENITKPRFVHIDYKLGKTFDKILKTVGDILYKAGSFFMGE